MNDAQATPDLTTTPASPEQARTMLNTLRDQRMAGRVTDRDYLSRVDYLGRVAEGEQGVTQAPRYETPEVQLERSFDEAMSPPRSPADYRFEHLDGGPSTPDELQRDRGVREAMHEAGIPAAYGTYMHETVARLSARFANASSEEIAAHVEGVANTLRAKWGDAFKARLDALDEFVAGIGGELGEALAAAPYVLADPLLMAQLDSIVQHRARSGSRR